MVKSLSRLLAAPYPPSCARFSWPLSSGEGWPTASRSISASSRRDGRSGGFLLLFLTPLLALLGLFLLGSLRVAAGAQRRVALQSRLDVCAIRLGVEREKLYRRLAELNTAIDLTVAGIVAARAAILVPGAGQAAGASEEALLRANAALRAAGDSAVLAAATKEYAALRCAANSWSREEAACGTTPPLAMAFERARTPFPDVAGALHLRGGKIGQVRCAGRGGLVSQLALTGNPALRPGVFGDRYEQ